MKQCYKVSLKTSDVAKTRVFVSDRDLFLDVDRGEAYVVTDCPEKIFEFFGKENVMAINSHGIGYVV
jgi:hypothetical protein